MAPLQQLQHKPMVRGQHTDLGLEPQACWENPGQKMAIKKRSSSKRRSLFYFKEKRVWSSWGVVKFPNKEAGQKKPITRQLPENDLSKPEIQRLFWDFVTCILFILLALPLTSLTSCNLRLFQYLGSTTKNQDKSPLNSFTARTASQAIKMQGTSKMLCRRNFSLKLRQEKLDTK